MAGSIFVKTYGTFYVKIPAISMDGQWIQAGMLECWVEREDIQRKAMQENETARLPDNCWPKALSLCENMNPHTKKLQ